MAKDDFFKIVYVVLKELYECKKQNCRPDPDSVSPQRFRIPEGYLLDILCELREAGYVKGFQVKETKTGRCISSLDGLDITMKGIEYLQDNSKMQQVYHALKEVRDWMPGL